MVTSNLLLDQQVSMYVLLWIHRTSRSSSPIHDKLLLLGHPMRLILTTLAHNWLRHCAVRGPFLVVSVGCAIP